MAFQVFCHVAPGTVLLVLWWADYSSTGREGLLKMCVRVFHIHAERVGDTSLYAAWTYPLHVGLGELTITTPVPRLNSECSMIPLGPGTTNRLENAKARH